ncbi:MAG: SDR family NAD(P)-dependent oxidoreductase, partial [Phycisphaerales bacterium]
MDLDLKGTRALVCGSSSGIGRACAIELAGLGAHITLMARDEAKLEGVAAALPRGAGQNHNYIVADLGNPAAVRAA